ncbi:MAG: DUF951 domain-containing protein [Ruminococcaceae bacterium]|nr:DUF951 domain-containing protein [Oscillospiraceae bacterium]
MPLLKVGDILTLKKSHPCGCDKFEILRLGSDIKIKCTSCAKALDIPREKLEKRIKFIN